MRIILQRVRNARCFADDHVIGEIDRGYVLLVGIEQTDTKQIAERMLEKIKNLRIFEDADGKTNLNAAAVNGQVLLVSQFTLYAECKKGNRPSFINAADPVWANTLYDYMVSYCQPLFFKVATGKFGADMQIELINDGPFTLYLDSKQLFA